MSLNPQQFEDILKQAPDEFAKIFNNAPFVAVLDLNGAIQQRIFNEGGAANNQGIGKYNKEFGIKFSKSSFSGLNKLAQRRVASLVDKRVNYIELRKKAGRQVDYVDLEFTGGLRKSIQIVTLDNKAAIIISDAEHAVIAREMEVNFNKPIFQPSEKESSEAKEKMINFIQEEIKNLIATWR